jgi:hypothetical protein
MQTFHFNAPRAGVVTATWALASDSAAPYGYDGNDFAQGLIGTLMMAEELAAQAGVVAPVLLDGEPVVPIGAARDKIKTFADPAVRTLYLASYAAVRELHDTARPRQVGTPLGVQPLIAGAFVGAPILAIAFLVPVLVAVVAIAAVIAGAWYAVEAKKTEIEVAGHNLRQAQLAQSYTGLGLAAMKSGQPIPDNVWQGLGVLADQEAAHGAWIWPVVLVGGAIVAGGGAYLALRKSGRG